MALYLFPLGMGQFFDDSAAVLAGGKLYSYEAGTTTPLATYQDISGATPHANPIVLDADGRPPAPIWLTADKRYKFVLQDSSSTELDQWDNVFGIQEAGSTVSEWLSGATPTYVTASTFTQQGDTTAIMQVGRRLKLTDSGTLYATIVGSSYASGTNKTTVTVEVDSEGSMTSSLSAVEYGMLNATNISMPYTLRPVSLSDAAHTLQVWTENRITPTTARVQTLPTTNVAAGDTIRVVNLATDGSQVTINASGGTTIIGFINGTIELYALQATPTTSAHWGFRVLNGGISTLNYVDATGTSGTDNTAETVKSITIPANTLTKAGQGIKIKVVYDPSTTTSIAGTLALNGTTLAGNTAADTNNVEIEVDAYYQTSTTGQMFGRLVTQADAVTLRGGGGTIGSLDWTADQTLALTQSAAVGTHLTVKMITVEAIYN